MARLSGPSARLIATRSRANARDIRVTSGPMMMGGPTVRGASLQRTPRAELV